MKLTATGGTDAASIVLYWPDLLPDDADARLKDDPVEFLEELERDGKLIWFPCEGDGGYSLAVFVGEEPPADLVKGCREHKSYPSLTVSGEGYFGGTEYVCKRDCALREKYPHMSTKVAIPAGTYTATVYEVQTPQELESAWMREHVSPGALRLSNVMGVIVVTMVLCAIAALGGLAFMSRTVWFSVAGAFVALILLACAIARTAGYRAVAAARMQFERTYPSYVVRVV